MLLACHYCVAVKMSCFPQAHILVDHDSMLCLFVSLVAAAKPVVPLCLRQNKDQALLESILEPQASQHSKLQALITLNSFKFLASHFLYVVLIQRFLAAPVTSN